MHALSATNGTPPAPTDLVARFVMHILDEIDYGVVLVRAGAIVVYANHMARKELRQAALLDEACEQLKIATGGHLTHLRAAIDAAVNQAKRRLVTLKHAEHGLTCAVVPMSRGASNGDNLALLLLGRQHVCEKLSAHWFGVTHGLTPMELAVLDGLCSGQDPAEIAAGHRVSISTIRTQIASLRDKTGAHSVNKLLRQVALLPPLVPVLRLIEA